jgi:hypothetical protein
MAAAAVSANKMYCRVAGFFGTEKPLAAMVAGGRPRRAWLL